jgi:hypothetical protein
MLIETMWENIIDGELARTEELPVGSKVAMMGNKMRALGKVYAASGGGSSSSRYFPVEFIVRKLELFSSRARADHTWVFSALMAVGISLPKLLDVYNRCGCFELISNPFVPNASFFAFQALLCQRTRLADPGNPEPPPLRPRKDPREFCGLAIGRFVQRKVILNNYAKT